jgi:hypothetical protein
MFSKFVSSARLSEQAREVVTREGLSPVTAEAPPADGQSEFDAYFERAWRAAIEAEYGTGPEDTAGYQPTSDAGRDGDELVARAPREIGSIPLADIPEPTIDPEAKILAERFVKFREATSRGHRDASTLTERGKP